MAKHEFPQHIFGKSAEVMSLVRQTRRYLSLHQTEVKTTVSRQHLWYADHPLSVRFKPKGLVLGIETSCDETAMAVLTPDGKLLHHSVASQWDLLNEHKGVFPLQAAKKQEQNLPLVLSDVLSNSGTSLSEFEVLAVTVGPGLGLCLQEGLKFARRLAESNPQLRFVGVNHLEAHILVGKLSHPELRFPFLAILVSGGHTMLCLVKGVGDYEILAQTIDDAIGEAFDKVAVMLGLETKDKESFGACVERHAREAIPGLATFPLPMRDLTKDGNRYSFSGLKSSVRRQIELKGNDLSFQDKCNFAYAFQETAIRHVLSRFEHHLPQITNRFPSLGQVVLCGGTACNSIFRKRLQEASIDRKLEIICPPRDHCTDNGIMIAYTGLIKASVGHEDSIRVGYSDKWALQ
jgi:N6-L-threonylcarbamoyladenine synthase